MRKPFDIKGIRFGEGRPVICVPVVETERDAVIDRISALADRDVQMIEWRADCFGQLADPDQVRGILEEIRPLVDDVVMLFTVRSKNQGGNSDLAENDLFYLDEIAAKSGCIDMIDLEYFELSRPEREIRRLSQMGVRVIASHHDFFKTPQNAVLSMVMDQLAGSGADIAKLAVMPNSADDVIRLLDITDKTREKYPDVALLTISMGEQGVISRVAGETFGSCITFGADGEGSAPGQLQADTLESILDALHSGMSQIDECDPVPERPLFLIGFMGVGKTVVSRQLSSMLGMREVDLDEELVLEGGMPIAEMFERYGEEYFRDRETDMLRRIAAGPPAVISCGGGCVLRGENVSAMKEKGTVILLTAEPGTVYDRVKDGEERPVLNGHMDVEYIASLMEQRRPAYEAACDIRIATDDKTPPQIAEEIRAALR